MMIVENTRLLSRLCELTCAVKNMEIKFDPYSRQVRLVNEHSTNSISQWRLYLSVLLTLTYASQCCLAKSSTQIETVLVWVSLAILLLQEAGVFDIRNKHGEFRDFINIFFQLDSIVPGKPKEGRTPFVIMVNLAVIYAMILSAILFPIGFVHILHWMNPCKPTLLGYWVIRKCYTKTDAANIAETVVDFLSQFIVTLAYHWLWSFTYHGGLVIVTVMQILAMISMRQLIQR